MATAPRLPHLLLLLRRLLLRALKCGANALPSALARIRRKLAFFWFILRSRFARKPSGGIDDELPLGPTKGVVAGSSKEPEPRRLIEQAEQISSSEEECKYTTDSNGEVISLDNVAFSLYPFAGGIHNASRSSQNLNASRSAHTHAIASRSRSGSPYPSSTHTNPRIDDDEDYTFTVDSPNSPAPRRQFSTSLPTLPHNPTNGSVIRLTDLNRQQGTGDRSHGIPFVSGSPSPTAIDASQNDPLTFISHHRFSSPRDIEESSIQIPVVSTSHSQLSQCLDNEQITPIMPEGSQRYTRRPRIPRVYTSMTIEPLTYAFEKPLPPPGWVKVNHPEGVRYFFNPEERVYTDADLYDDNILEQATQDIATLKDFVTFKNITLPSNTDLVIDLFYDEEKTIKTVYYYVNHESRSIFFLDTYDATALPSWYEIQGINTECHLGHEIEAQYWYFVQLYPSSLQMSHALASELRDLILHFIGDCMTSPTTTAPFTLDDLFRILPLTNSAEDNTGQKCTGAVSFLSRQMYVFARSRFLNFHGEAHARLERNFSVHGLAIHQRTWLVKTLSLFLFSAPDFHLRNLQDMWIDGIMNKNVWEQSVKKMTDEWQEFVLFGTVMLNANVAFLAIQSVDTNRDPYRSPAQIASYFSVIASLGSIVIGLLLTRQNRTKSRETADEVQEFLSRRSHPRLGLETLAILHSLPYALLMWGMVSFMAAFSFECFQGSNIQTRTLIGSFAFAVAALILWAVVTSWEKHKEDEPVEPIEPTAGSSRKSQMSVSSQNTAETTLLSRFLSLPVLWMRRSTMDSARTVV